MLICLCRFLSLLHFIRQKFKRDLESECSMFPTFFFPLKKLSFLFSFFFLSGGVLFSIFNICFHHFWE